ncbi:MAG: oxidoreductase [Actinomycetota bacterium]
MSGTSQVALVTGCSTGIGRATALALNARGVTTYASARRVETLADLEDAGCRSLPLDVTDEAARVHAVETIERELGRLDILVNNAGYAQYGPVEEVPIERWRVEFETNVFGALRLIQLSVPGMRERGYGRIVNMSSMGGEMALPLGGPYHASKFALEALSDALRYEVRPFGIDVVLIQPGLVTSNYGKTASDGLKESLDGPYGSMAARFIGTMATTYTKGARGSASPEKVAKVVAHAATTRRPRTRYKITSLARLLPAARNWLPDRLWDALLHRSFGRPDAPD